MKYFKLPDLGEGLPEADILEWHVQEGDTVTMDQLLVSVETAKAIVDIPAPQNGVIAHLFGATGDTIHTGEPLVEFVGEADDSGTVVGELKSDHQPTREDHFYIGAAPSTAAHKTHMTPAVRALAKRMNVDAGQLKGSGHHGQITPGDIEQAARNDRLHGKAEPLRGVRKQMAKNMVMAHVEVVPVTLFDDVDVHLWPDHEDITLRLVHAIAVGCQTEPALNAWFDGEQLARRLHRHVNLGVAVDTGHGLFVPVIRDVGNRQSTDIRDGLNRLRNDVVNRTIPPSELQGATITLSNFGTLSKGASKGMDTNMGNAMSEEAGEAANRSIDNMIVGRYATPVVVPPTVAILGAGAIREQAVAVEGQVVVRRVLPLSLSFDHRAATGGEATRFLSAVMCDLTQASIR